METARTTTAPRPQTKLRGLAPYLSALVGALVFISILGHQVFQVEALQVRLNVQPSLAGQTVFEIPPLAKISAHTHATPVRLSVRLESIDPQSVQKMLDQKQSGSSLISTFTKGLRTAAALFTLKLLLLSAAGGAFGVFIWRRQPDLIHLKGALAATLAVGILMAGTYLTYDAERFKNPKFDGALKVAPWAIGVAGQALDKIDSLGNKMVMVADNVHQLYNQIDRLQPFEDGQEGMVRVLQVSDIHNNPAALDFIQRIAGLFRVDMIIDSGDITDFGTPLEGLLLERLAGIKVPYIFIPGNHDSQDTLKKLRSVPGVTVLDQPSTIKVKKLTIAGVPAPSAQSSDIEPPPLDLIPVYAQEIESYLKGQKDQPDLLVVHNNRIARMLGGKVPVILHGHDHKLAVEKHEGSLFINPGSTGAAGMRRLQGDKTPYSLVIQYYAPLEGKMKLLAADTITVNNLESGFHLERHVFDAKTGD